MNGLVQVLSARYSSEQIVWARTASHLVFILALFAPRLGAAVVRTARLRWQLGRTMVHLGSMLMFFNGVKHLELAKAASISFTAPFLVALLAWPLLGERMPLGGAGPIAAVVKSTLQTGRGVRFQKVAVRSARNARRPASGIAIMRLMEFPRSSD
jgi:drug/metabolite transporter (DMT)-like permease